MVAAGMTYAYLNNLVMLSLPFVTAILEKVTIGVTLPPGLLPSVVAISVGSALVIYGQCEEAHPSGGMTIQDCILTP